MSDGGVETSPLAVSLLVIAVLLFVILATGWVMWREERAFHDVH